MLRIMNDAGKNNIIDLRHGTNHPCSLLYSEIYPNALLRGRFVDARSQPGFSLKGGHPFVLAIKNAIALGVDDEGITNAIEKSLREYYQMVEPKSAAEWLGLDLDANNKLMTAPPWGAVFPWRARTIESYMQAYKKAALLENSLYGATMDITKGWLFSGPVSPEKLKIEASRLAYVLKQISKEGFKRSDSPDGDVKATALIDGSDQWKWLVTAGNHRASAASALGYEEIPIRVNLVVRRGDAPYWPHVVNGLYSVSNALKVFDMYFNGITPPVTYKWILSNLENGLYDKYNPGNYTGGN